MTQEEFDNTSWGANTTVIYQGDTREAVAVDFQEKLIGLQCDYDEDDRNWVRCENVSILEELG